jgi:DNA primase
MQYEDLVRGHLSVKNAYGEEAICLCIFHDERTASLQVNMETGLYICFSCGASGGPKSLLAELGISHYEPGDDDLKYLMEQIRNLDRGVVKEEKVYAESLLKRFKHKHSAWIERNITTKTQAMFELGYYPLGDALTIPVRDIGGRLLGVIRRNINWEQRDLPKYEEPRNIKKSRHLYGGWLAAKSNSREVVLVEGPLDAVKVWQAGYVGLAICGSSLTEQQVGVLKRLDIDRVTLFFDNDLAGRKAAKTAQGIKTNRRRGQSLQTYHEELDLRQWFEVRQVDYKSRSRGRTSQGELADDPGEMTEKGIAKMLRNATLLA